MLSYKEVFFSVAFFLITSCSPSTKSIPIISIDGSSTVYPITESIAEEFQKSHPHLRVGIGVSGTGGGFRKLNSKQTEINNASRKIKDKEVKLLKEKGLEVLELPVAYDGLSVVIHKDNTWVDYLSLKELHEVWKPQSTVKRWSDIRPHWPKEKIEIYGPGSDSGTFDYFTKKVNKKSGVSRTNYIKSEDDHILVLGVAGSKNALGYFGFSYYYNNKQKLKAVPIGDTLKKAVAPTKQTIQNGTYKPLSRQLFIYVRKDVLKEPHIQKFLRFYMEHSFDLVPSTGYIPLNKETYKQNLKRL